MVNVGLRGFIWEQKSVEHKARLYAPADGWRLVLAPSFHKFHKHKSGPIEKMLHSPVRCLVLGCCCAGCRWRARLGA